MFQSTVASNGRIDHALLPKESQEKDEPNELVDLFKRVPTNERNISEGDISIVGLKRRVGFVSGTALIVGTMIGGLRCGIPDSHPKCLPPTWHHDR